MTMMPTLRLQSSAPPKCDSRQLQYWQHRWNSNRGSSKLADLDSPHLMLSIAAFGFSIWPTRQTPRQQAHCYRRERATCPRRNGHGHIVRLCGLKQEPRLDDIAESRLAGVRIDDYDLLVKDVSVCMVGALAETYVLKILRLSPPSWLPATVDSPTFSFESSIMELAASLSHGVGVAIVWLLGASAASIFERMRYSVTPLQTLVGVGQAGIIASTILIAVIAMGTVAPLPISETFNDLVLDVVTVGVLIFSWRIYRMHGWQSSLIWPHFEAGRFISKDQLAQRGFVCSKIDPKVCAAVLKEADILLDKYINGVCSSAVSCSIHTPLNRRELKIALSEAVGSAIAAAVNQHYPVLERLVSAEGVLVELSVVSSDHGAPMQLKHPDTSHICPTDEGSRFTIAIALQDIMDDMGPTLIWDGTQSYNFHEKDHRERELLLQCMPPSRLIMNQGGVAIYNSMVFHCGGANKSNIRRSVLFASFQHPEKLVRGRGGTDSILPEYKGSFSLKYFHSWGAKHPKRGNDNT